MESINESLGPWSLRYWNQKNATNVPANYPVHITEIIERDDPRYNSPKMKEAIRKGIEGILERDTFKIVLREENRKTVTRSVEDLY